MYGNVRPILAPLYLINEEMFLHYKVLTVFNQLPNKISDRCVVVDKREMLHSFPFQFGYPSIR